MPPMQPNPLTQALRTLLSKYSGYSLSDKSKLQKRPNPMTKKTSLKPLTVVNPLQTIFKGLSSTISQITKSSRGEDYNAIVKSFLPENAKLITPEFPRNSSVIQFADIDGDMQNELISSYRHNNDIKTIILKKQNDKWQKTSEISNVEYETIHYRNIADMTGEGKKQLLIGLTAKGKGPTLHGYLLENNKVNRLFDRNYHRLEVLNTTGTGKTPKKAQLAVWTEKDTDNYNIEVLHWNGTQLESLKNTAPYYYRSVVPYYAQKIKKTPYTPSHWYNLADSLEKAGAPRDALTAIEVGIRQDKDSAFKDRFIELKNRITKK